MPKSLNTVLLLILLLALVLSGCSAPPSQEEIGIVLAGYLPCELRAGEKLPISLKGTIPQNATIDWSATGGSFNPKQGFPTVYTAPSEPGSVVITVNVTINGIQQPYNVPCTIKPAEVAALRTQVPASTPTATPRPTATPTASPAASPTATPTVTLTSTPRPLVLASTEKMDGWTPELRRAYGKAIYNSASLVPGREGNAVRLSFDVTNWGYVTLTHELDFRQALRVKGVRFDYQGGTLNDSRANNTIEIKLIFRWPEDKEDLVFGYALNGSTDTKGAWKTVELSYADFDCWWPVTLCRAHKNTMDLSNLSRMDYVVSNKPDKGDIGGTGYVIFEDLIGIK